MQFDRHLELEEFPEAEPVGASDGGGVGHLGGGGRGAGAGAGASG